MAPIHFYSLSDSILSKEYWQESVENIPKDSYQFCYLPADHQQKTAYLASLKNKFTLVEGAEGSGKNYAICNVLIGQLMNGKSTIIIGQSIAELEKITDKLTQEGFGEYIFLFKNSELDKDNLLESIIAKKDKTSKQRVSKTSDFSKNYQQFHKIGHQLESVTTGYAKNVFDINKGKELLDTQLHTNDFEFDFLEYEQLKDKIESCESIFQETFSFYHALNDVSDAYFTENPLPEAKNKLLAKLNKYLNQTRKVQQSYYQKVGFYKQELEDYYDNYYDKLYQQLVLTQESVDQLHLQFGKEYDQTSSIFRSCN